MIPRDLFSRIPPPTTLLVLCSILHQVECYVAPAPISNSGPTPTQTQTIPYHHLDVEPWPQPTPWAGSVDRAGPLTLERRKFNTICGYIGGDTALPATCSAGSHCVVDKEHSAIGCCPDSGPCTQGIFTDCVDGNSEPQTEVNPYVYTCSGGDVCYKNSFNGGYFQYGCGSTSGLATSVIQTASGRPSLSIGSVSVALTATATSLSKPTTLGTKKFHSKTTKTEETSKTKTKSIVHTTRKTTSTDKTTSTVATSSVTSSVAASAPESGSGSDGDGDDGDSSHTPAIIGGTVGGVGALFILAAVGIWLWRRKKGNSRQGPGLNQDTQYISPMADRGHNFVPLDSDQDAPDSALPRAVPAAAMAEEPVSSSGHGAVPFQPNYPYGYGPGSTLGGIAALRNSDPSSVDTEQIPLTEELDDFSRGFNTALDDIQDDHNDRPTANEGGMTAYPRGGEGRPLWQQNRRQSRHLMWM